MSSGVDNLLLALATCWRFNALSIRIFCTYGEKVLNRYYYTKEGLFNMLQTIESINNVVNNLSGCPGYDLYYRRGFTWACGLVLSRSANSRMRLKPHWEEFLRKRGLWRFHDTFRQSVLRWQVVGTGNIAWCAGAIAIGGPGAVFLDVGFRAPGMCNEIYSYPGGTFPWEKQT